MTRTSLFALLTCFSFYYLSAQNIIHVNPAAPGGGNGDAWATAYNSLQDALAEARSSGGADEIWVAQGTYYPHASDQDSAFNIPANVTLYGGLTVGGSLSGRDITGTTTTLSGDIDQNGNPSGNSRTVVYTQNVANSVIVDGFTITGGQGEAQTDKDTTLRQHAGGGWYNLATGSNTSNPKVQQVIFKLNKATTGKDRFPHLLYAGAYGGHGGAFFNYAKGTATASPHFTGCKFEDNAAGMGGLGISLSYMQNGQTLTKYQKGGFGGNGGAVAAIYQGQATGDMRFDNCMFKRNKSGKGGKGTNGGSAGHGGAISVDDQGNRLARLTLNTCQFEMNEGGEGGDTLQTKPNNPTGESYDGGTGGWGGALYAHNSRKITIDGCSFVQNHAGDGSIGNQSGGAGGNGGVLYFDNDTTDAELVMDNTTFDQNRAGNGATANHYGGQGGGAGMAYILVKNNRLKISGNMSTWKDNHAGEGGFGNTEIAGGSAGGLFNIFNRTNDHKADSLIMLFSSCDFLRNHAGKGSEGGVFYGNTEYEGTRWHFQQCDFFDNYAGDGGSKDTKKGGNGGVFSWSFDRGEVGQKTVNPQNSIAFETCEFKRNHAGAGWDSPSGNSGYGGVGGVFYVREESDKSTILLSHCEFEGNYSGAGGESLGSSGGGGDGGVMFYSSSSSSTAGKESRAKGLRIRDCTFQGNHTGDGGKVSGSDDSADGGRGGCFNITTETEKLMFELKNTTFTQNYTGNGGELVGQARAGEGGYGGVLTMYAQSSNLPHNRIDFSIDNCIFDRNRTGNGGEALQGESGSGGFGGAFYGSINGDTVRFSCVDSEFLSNETGNGGNGKTGSGVSGFGGAIDLRISEGNLDKLVNHMSFERTKFKGNHTGMGGSTSGDNDSGKYSGNGGAMYLFSGNYNSEVKFDFCEFLNNYTGNGGNGAADGAGESGYGGAIGLAFIGYNADSLSLFHITNSKFEGNFTGMPGTSTQSYTDAYSGSGGAISFEGRSPKLDILLQKTDFINNKTGDTPNTSAVPGATGLGGAIKFSNYVGDKKDSLVFKVEECIFKDNQTGNVGTTSGGYSAGSGSGGAMYLQGGAYFGNVHFLKSEFINNKTGKGGDCSWASGTTSSMTSGNGGALELKNIEDKYDSLSSLTFSLCKFQGNHTGEGGLNTLGESGYSGSGGAINTNLTSVNAKLLIENSEFLNNYTANGKQSGGSDASSGKGSTSGNGGGINSYFSGNDIFANNTDHKAKIDLRNNRFVGNHTGNGGGGAYGGDAGMGGMLNLSNSQSNVSKAVNDSLFLVNNWFEGNYTGNGAVGTNSTGKAGYGGVLSTGTSLGSSSTDPHSNIVLAKQNVWLNNRTGTGMDGAGGIWSHSSLSLGSSPVRDSLFFINNTVVGNTTSHDASCFNLMSSSAKAGFSQHLAIRNGLFWNNRANGAIDMLKIGNAMTVDSLHSMIEGYTGKAPHIYAAITPDFKDAPNKDFSLKRTSPVVDCGKNNFISPLTKDYANDTRIQGPRVDLGAYESDCNLPNFVVTATSPTCAGGQGTIVVDIQVSGNYEVSTDNGQTWTGTGNKHTLLLATGWHEIRIRAKNGNGCQSCVEKVEIKAAPAGGGSLANLTEQGCSGCGMICTTICQNGTAPALDTYITSGNTTFESGASLLWYKDVSGAKGASLAGAPSVNTATKGKKYFWVEQTKGGCTSNPIRVKVKVNKVFVPAFSSVPSQGCGGSSAQLNLAKYVSDPGKKATKFTFYTKDPVANPSATAIGSVQAKKGVVKTGQNMIVTLNPATPTYWVKAKVPNGCGGVASATVSMPTAQASVNPIADLTVSAGSSVNIALTGQNTTNILWFSPGVFNNPNIGLMGAVGTSPLKFTAQNSGNTNLTAKIRVVPYNGNCAGTSLDFNITVKPSGVPRQGPVNSLQLLGRQLANSEVALNWQITYDQELIRFEVEKEVNEGEWASIGEVVSHGNGSYDYIDYEATGKTNRYRLKLIHPDGREVWSNIILVGPHHDVTPKDSERFTLYPNPTEGRVIVRQEGSVSSRQWQLSDLMGKVILQGEMKTKEVTLDLSTLSPGVYQVVTISQDGKRSINRVMKK